MEIMIDHVENVVQRMIREEVEANPNGTVFVSPRQHGKTTQCCVEVLLAATNAQNPGARAALVCRQLDMNRRNAWDTLKRLAKVIPGHRINETRLSIDFPHNDGRASLHGSDDPDTLRGLANDFVAVDETQLADKRLFPEVILPSLAARRGKALLVGTALSRHDPLWEMFQKVPTLAGWGRRLVKASEVNLLSPEQLALYRSIMSEEAFRREFESEPSESVDGSVYGRYLDAMEKESRLGRFPWDSSTLVSTSWDIGRDMTSIWFFQADGRGWVAIDYYQNAGMSLEHYIKVVREKPYAYREHIGPHDLAVTEFTNDRSRLDVAYSLGVDFNVAPRLSVEEGIDQVRRFFPKLSIDRVACEKGVAALRDYAFKWSDTLRDFSREPVHNWASHPSDALRYFVTGRDDDLGDYEPSKPAILNFDVYTFNKGR
jgi:phage terminase large subunit